MPQLILSAQKSNCPELVSFADSACLSDLTTVATGDSDLTREVRGMRATLEPLTANVGRNGSLILKDLLSRSYRTHTQYGYSLLRIRSEVWATAKKTMYAKHQHKNHHSHNEKNQGVNQAKRNENDTDVMKKRSVLSAVKQRTLTV